MYLKKMRILMQCSGLTHAIIELSAPTKLLQETLMLGSIVWNIGWNSDSLTGLPPSGHSWQIDQHPLVASSSHRQLESALLSWSSCDREWWKLIFLLLKSSRMTNCDEILVVLTKVEIYMYFIESVFCSTWNLCCILATFLIHAEIFNFV